MSSVDHYENFPVASWLCPPPLRAAVMAIYHFARTADDIADEGTATPEQRRSDLARYRRALQAAAANDPQKLKWRTSIVDLLKLLGMPFRRVEQQTTTPKATAA